VPAFLDGWAQALRTDVARERSIADHQRFLDLAPVSYGAAVLRHPGYGVAAWNAHERALGIRVGNRGVAGVGAGREIGEGFDGGEAASTRKGDVDRFTARGESLHLVRFAGFDPRRPSLLSSTIGSRPRVLLSENPVLARLCAERARDIMALALKQDFATRPGDGTSSASENIDTGTPAADGTPEAPILLVDGTTIDERMRRLARRAVAAAAGQPSATTTADSGHREAVAVVGGSGGSGGPGSSSGFAGRASDLPPDPWDLATIANFYDWLASSDPTDEVAPTLPRYIGELYRERRDLQWHFGRVGTVDMAHFREWVANHGLDEAGAPQPLRQAIAATPWWSAPTGVSVAPPSALHDGVVLAGYLRAESGVGEAARLAHESLLAAGIETRTVVLGRTPSRQAHHFDPPGGVKGSETGPVGSIADRRINLIWVNADQLPGFASTAGPALFEGRYNIGFWAWETERLPGVLAQSASMLDEVWVPSPYVADAVRPVVEIPVHVFPHPIVAPPVDTSYDLAELGVPPGFRFLFTYDYLSSFARKNPLGVLSAFTAAFEPGEGPVLVLKSVNGHLRTAEQERLLLAAMGRPDVVIVDGYLAAGERGALIASCDCFVSLHRSEGFGLGLGEAMALGKAVIATNYSGNLAFMDARTAMLVPATRRVVGPDAEPYLATDHWADPDLDAAAQAMRTLAADPSAAAALGRRAQVTVLGEHGMKPAARFVDRRVGEIHKMLRKGYVSRAAEGVRAML